MDALQSIYIIHFYKATYNKMKLWQIVVSWVKVLCVIWWWIHCLMRLFILSNLSPGCFLW